MAVGRDELRTVLDSELRVPAFKDYCPNGLQVEGRSEINVIVSGGVSGAARQGGGA